MQWIPTIQCHALLNMLKWKLLFLSKLHNIVCELKNSLMYELFSAPFDKVCYMMLVRQKGSVGRKRKIFCFGQVWCTSGLLQSMFGWVIRLRCLVLEIG